MKYLNGIVLFLVMVVILGFPGCKRGDSDPDLDITVQQMVDDGIDELIAAQDSDGTWHYEGVHQVNGGIPIGFRVGGTATVCQALLFAETSREAAATSALLRGVNYILQTLDNPGIVVSTQNIYDVRIWAQAYVVTFLCQLRASGRAGETGQVGAIDAGISQMTEAIIIEEIAGGGWHYANHTYSSAVTSAVVVQALLWARSQGENVPDDILLRSRDFLLLTRYPEGVFRYDQGERGGMEVNLQLPGSVGRSALCETTLYLMGANPIEPVRDALNAFHTHWDALREYYQVPGTHGAPYGVAPYYFFFGHFYAGQSIELLPQGERNGERNRLRDLIRLTREPDGSWNDRVFHQSRCYGTAMAIMSLQSNRVPLPPAVSLTN